MNRIDRVSAILIQLQSKKWVTAGEIAERFGISLRTVYRDLKALDEAGVPIGAEAGKGYYLVDGYRLPPVMFSREEASALLLAGKMMEKFVDASVTHHYESALYKIRSVLPGDDKDFVSGLSDNIEVMYSNADKSLNNNFLVIQQSLVNKTILNISYQSISKNELTCREIEPLGLCFYSFSWHLIAFCRLRNEYRDFRTDRIQFVENSEKSFVPREKISVLDYFRKYAKNSELFEVILRINKCHISVLSSAKYYYGFVSQQEYDDFIEMDFVTGDLAYFGKWLLMFADIVEVVSPVELKVFLRDIIENIYKKFQNC
jgi:predicted DNA-binding transcriptional regulator YafY